METLKNALLNQTADFKATFIEKSIAFAEKEFARAEIIAKWSKEDWCKYFGLEPRILQNPTGPSWIDFPNNFHNTKDAKTYLNLCAKYITAARGGSAAFIEKAIKSAEAHYTSSIEKLAFRITEKGLNIDSIKVSSGWVGINFECEITDGNKKVRAFTIIAEGEIQKPHYRYLIK